MRSISPSQNGDHLGEVGEDLGGPQRRLGRVVEVVGERPRGAGLDGRPESVQTADGRRRSRCEKVVVVMAPVWHDRA